jgi:hypothetical protein
MTRYYGKHSDFPGYSIEAFRGMQENEQFDAIVEWFRAHYEDPANETPYDSEEGGYLYIWGGPYDAREVIQEEFEGVATDDLMERAIAEIELGGWEWVRRGRGDSPAEGELTDDEIDAFIDAAVTEVVDGEGVWPKIIAVPQTSEKEARRRLRETLDELEEEIKFLSIEVNVPPPAMGHNNPPEAIDPASAQVRQVKREIASIAETIEQIREITQRDEPSAEEVISQRNRLAKAVISVGKYVGRKIDKGIDQSINVGVVLGIANYDKVLIAVNNVIQAVAEWISILRWPF